MFGCLLVICLLAIICCFDWDFDLIDLFDLLIVLFV